MTFSINTTRNLIVAFAAVALFVAIPAAPAQAADYGFDVIDTFYPMDTGFYADTEFYPDTVSTFYPDTVSTYYPDTVDYAYDYGSYGGYGMGYGVPISFGGGSWGWGGGYGGGSGYSSSVSTVYAPTNTNTCTAVNSCNSYVDDHSVVSINNSTPSYPVYSTPSYYPVYYNSYSGCGSAYGGGCITPSTPCNTCSCLGNCYTQPYVTLSAVPYTGLDLGPMGTFLYWSFLILWCLAAAYFIAVKKVQNKVFAALSNFFYPKAAASAPVADAPAATPKIAASFSGIDSFIQSQINRPGRAGARA